MPSQGSSPRVMFRVQCLQALARDVRVDLRGGDVGVTEKELHDPQVGTVVDEVRGESVAQNVRRELLGGYRALTVAADQVPERLPRHAGSARGEKERVRSAFSLIQIARDPVDRLLTERYEALLGAFAHHAQNARVEVHLEGLQPD